MSYVSLKDKRPPREIDRRLPSVQRKRLRTERINKEVRRRTRVAQLFPNVASAALEGRRSPARQAHLIRAQHASYSTKDFHDAIEYVIKENF